MKAAAHAAPRPRRFADGTDPGAAMPLEAASPPGDDGAERARRVGLSPRLAQRLLEELIYERVRTQVDLLELSWFEQEIDQGIERILDDLDGGTDARAEAAEAAEADAPPGALAGVLVDRAWSRVTDEWTAMRTAALDDWCPICEAFESTAADPHAPPQASAQPRSRKATRTGGARRRAP